MTTELEENINGVITFMIIETLAFNITHIAIEL